MIARFLFNPWTVGIVGISAVSLVIWYVGPMIAIGNVRPFESALVRWILIGVIALIWLARRLWKWFQLKRANRKLMEGLTKAPVAAAGPTESEQEMKVLAERFDDAVETLRKMKLQSTKGGFSALLARTGRQYLYELPWYVFIGPPGSGKTTALINSGLKFPLAEKLGTQAVKGVGGTRNCDWWFTDEAVLIDTAGRYTTQDSDAQVDKAAWDNFLVLLKRFRPRRPINGILLIMSAGDLLTQSARERAAHAEAARARIQELDDRLGIRFPVYVLITKTDLMAGFTEFFGDLGKEERAQVWGTTFPYSQEPNAPDALPILDGEWNTLVKRIIDRLPQRMRDERDLQKRALIFGFPQQVAALRASVADFLGQVFVTSRYGQAPLLRGVYLTSGTQEGRPIDRVVGTIARAFGFDGAPLGMQAAGSGRSYFLTKLLGDVIFEEQALAGTNLKWERRRLLLKWAGYAACAVLAVGLIAAWSISWSRNKAYVAEVDGHAVKVRENVGQLSSKADTNVVALLPILDQVKMIPVTDAILDGVPLSMTYGLYQGDKLTEGTHQVYRSLLRNTFLPRLIYRLEDQLRSASATDLELNYEALKTYLMLQDRTHLDADAVAAWIGTDWEVNLPRDVTAEQRASLDGHLKELLALEDFKSPIAADEQLIGRARATLAQYPLPQRIYSRLKRSWDGSEYPDFSVVSKGGPSAALVFQRTSGRPLSQGVPGMYSYDGYHNAFLQRVGEVSTQLSAEEEWVLGIDKSAREQAQNLLPSDQVAEQVRRLYLQDYVRVWDEFINDIRLKQPGTLSESIQTARTLSAPDSPVPVLMKAIVRETTLTTKQEAEKDITDKAEDKLAEKKRQLAQMFGAGGGPKPGAEGASKQIESIVDDHFAALRAWVGGGGEGPSPMQGALQLVNDAYLMLSAAETVVQSGSPAPPSDVPSRMKAEAPRMPEPFKSMMQDLNASSTALLLGQTRTNISRGIANSFGDFCAQAINGRYPFTQSSRDVTADDFAALFAPGGKIDQYFQQTLAPWVDTSTHPWSMKKVEGVPMSFAGSLIQFERADMIKKVFFRMGAQASYRFEFKPVTMDPRMTRFTLDVDGQTVSYSHGPPLPKWVSWPAPNGTSIVRITVEPSGASGSGWTTEGPWALFRMFDKARTERTAQPEKMFVTFTLDGRDVRFEVTAGSVQNPYALEELTRFQCPRSLG